MSYLALAKAALERLRVSSPAAGAERSIRLPAPPMEVSSPSARSSYPFPWPAEVPGLGARSVGPFEPCARCGHGSWVRYGAAVLCLTCAERAGSSAR